MALVLSSRLILRGCLQPIFSRSIYFFGSEWASPIHLTLNSCTDNFRLARALYVIAQMLVRSIPAKMHNSPGGCLVRRGFSQ